MTDKQSPKAALLIPLLPLRLLFFRTLPVISRTMNPTRLPLIHPSRPPPYSIDSSRLPATKKRYPRRILGFNLARALDELDYVASETPL